MVMTTTEPDLSVGTLGELENAVGAILEKALGNDKFCHVYADICVKLEERCCARRLVKTSVITGGLVYISLEEIPLWEVAGTFSIKEEACEGIQKQSERLKEFRPAHTDLECYDKFIMSSEVFGPWRATDGCNEKYLVSRPVVISGPFKSVTQAKKAAGQMRPVRHVLLERCQRELDVKTDHSNSPERLEQIKQRKIGTCRFLGALFRCGLVDISTMYRCIEMLLIARQNIAGCVAFMDPAAKPDEIKWEALCALLESAGSTLESSATDPIVSKYVWLMLAKIGDLSSNLASRVQDVVDLHTPRDGYGCYGEGESELGDHSNRWEQEGQNGVETPMAASKNGGEPPI